MGSTLKCIVIRPHNAILACRAVTINSACTSNLHQCGWELLCLSGSMTAKCQVILEQPT